MLWKRKLNSWKNMENKKSDFLGLNLLTGGAREI